VPGRFASFAGHHARRIDTAVFGADYSRYHALLRDIASEQKWQSLLDVGCGASSPVQGFADLVPKRVGVDGHEPSLAESKRRGIHTECVQANLLEIEARFGPRSFDCVTLLEVIEHFPREQGLELLGQCERIARKAVVLSTPNGFVPQSGTEDNPMMAHVSGWTVDDFRSRGYEVIGTAGWKPLRGELMQPRTPQWFTLRLSLVTQRFFEARPRHAYQLLCVKRMGG